VDDIELFRLFGSIFVDSDEANRSISRTEKNAEGLGSKLGNGIKTAAKWGAAIASGAVVAAGAVAGVAAPLVKAAANAQAMNAQFEQVFQDMQGNAQSTIDGLGKDFGMLPNRIKPAFTQMTSMFKGLGMDTEEAMSTAEQAVTLVADSAAFYDMSFEDANSALNSFIKGNYEGGEAIGLFANETQLASWASKELGVDWKNLDEAGKQVARLEFAKAMQESAGATGQASRESGSLENQLGNLRQAWEDIKAKFGEPILEPAVAMIQKLADWLTKVDTEPIINGFKSFVDFVDTNVISKFGNLLPFIMSTIDSVKSGFSNFVDFVKGLFSGEGNIGESFTRIFTSIQSVAVPILQDAISFIKGILDNLKQFWNDNGQQISDAVKSVFSFISSTIQFVMPFVKMIIEDAWNAIKNVINGALNIIMGLIKVFAGLFTGDMSKLWEGVKQLFSGAVEAIWGLLQIGFLGKTFKVIKGFGSKAVETWLES
jgi:phage-related protein